MVPFFKILLSLTGLLPVIACLSGWQACLAIASPYRSGFYLPDSIEQTTLKYRTIGNLIIIPVTINDTIHVNLILDTGTRNLVLFGKRFKKDFHFLPDKNVQFSGLGAGSPIFGQLSIKNKVDINSVVGSDIPVVVVPQKNIFASFMNVHGVIGYEIFLKFEVEINPDREEITFRSPLHKNLNPGFTRISMTVKDSRPVLDCQIFLKNGQRKICDLMLDTGSVFGLLVKSTDDNWASGTEVQEFGRGFNGNVDGTEVRTSKVQLNNFAFDVRSSKVIKSALHDYASVGMEILKHYTIILNYAKSYVEIKKIEWL